MREIRPQQHLGNANHGWLKTKYHFSFSDYYDPMRIHWGKLRVWNDDIIAPHSGFPPHPHNDMEIITYVYQGAITHTNSLGHQGRTVAGDVQIMSAGTGITHSEYNRKNDTTKLFQIWTLPDRKGNIPTWETKQFPPENKTGKLNALASGLEQDSEALTIQASARVLAITLQSEQETEYHTKKGHNIYMVSAKGDYHINGFHAHTHDGAAIKNETKLSINAIKECEIIMVETL